MAKANNPTIDTPGMASQSSKKPSQPPKPIGKQTTLLGFFSKTTSTPTPKRVDAHSNAPLTPLPTSEIGEDDSPIRIPGRQSHKENGGLRTPETPVVERETTQMDIDEPLEPIGSRKVFKPIYGF